MKMSNAFPSKYIRAADLDGRQHLLTFDRVEMEAISDDDRKPIIYFRERQLPWHSRGWVLNKTNSKVLVSNFGDDTDTYPGQKIVLFPATVDLRGETVEAIRCRMPKPSAKPAQLAPPPSTENPGDGLSDDIPF
jgi:hypothetical protein